MSPSIVWYQDDEKLHDELKEIIFEIIFCLKNISFRIQNNFGLGFSNFAGTGRNHGQHFSHLINAKKSWAGAYFSHSQ